LSPTDSVKQSDHLKNFRNLIVANDPLYPGIEHWVTRKVLPGIRSGQRAAYVAYLDEQPAITAVVKRGKDAKFCHLQIADHLQGVHLGELFFSLMAMEVRNFADSVHFTLPESLWESKCGFFNSFGFQGVQKAGVQYRSNDVELKCSASFSTVWSSVLQRLPRIIGQFRIGGIAPDSAILMSVRPEYAGAIMNGKKTVEIRRVFHKKWTGHRASLYATSPAQALVGEATIKEVVVGKPSEIWVQFGPEMGCSKESFFSYTGSAEEVSALILDNVTPYREYIPIDQLSNLLDQELTPPQSYCRLLDQSAWANAISVAALLHGSR